MNVRTTTYPVTGETQLKRWFLHCFLPNRSRLTTASRFRSLRQHLCSPPDSLDFGKLLNSINEIDDTEVHIVGLQRKIFHPFEIFKFFRIAFIFLSYLVFYLQIFFMMQFFNDATSMLYEFGAKRILGISTLYRLLTKKHSKHGTIPSRRHSLTLRPIGLIFMFDDLLDSITLYQL